MLLTKVYLLIYFSTCFGDEETQSETSRMILGQAKRFTKIKLFAFREGLKKRV